MKTLKIKTRPMGDTGIAVGKYGPCEVMLVGEDGSEEDITAGVRSIVVNMPLDDIITAKVEFFVNELDLEGVAVNE